MSSSNEPSSDSRSFDIAFRVSADDDLSLGDVARMIEARLDQMKPKPLAARIISLQIIEEQEVDEDDDA